MSVQNKEGALYWATGIDNSGLKQDADEAKDIIKGMSNDVVKSADSTSDAIDKIGDSAIKSAKAQINAQKEIVKQIEQDIKNLDKQFQQAAPGNAKSAALDELTSAKQALAEEKAILTELETKVNSTADKHVMLRTQISKVKDELSQMEMAGKRGSVEYDLLAKKLGDLNDQFKDTAAVATILANDQRGFQAVAQGVSGMAGAMSAATGIASLFGSENENLAKVQMRLQAVMAITIGLQQVAETLNKDSYFSVVLLSKAKEYLAATELKLAAATGVSTAAAKAFLLVSGGALLVGLAALGVAIYKVSEAHKAQTKAAVDAAKKEQEIQSEIAKGYATEQAKIQGLLSSIKSENVSRENKLKMIKELKDMIPGYTAELSKEGTVIRENKKAIDEYMISLEKSLKLKAAEKELEALYTQKYKLEKISQAAPQKTGNQFTKGLAKQGDENQTNTIIENTKKGVSKAASTGIDDIEKKIETIKGYISTNGLVSDVVLGTKGDKAIKEAYNATKDLQALLLDINQQTSSLLLEQQEDSLQKRLALIDQEKEAELQKIREKEVSIIEEYNKSNKDKKGFKALSTNSGDISNSLKTINPELANSLQTATTGITAAYGQKSVDETRKWNEEILDLARSFADKRVQLAYDYNKDIAKLEAEGQVEAASMARAERDKAISDETAQMIEESKLFKTITNEKLQISQQMTEKLLNQLRERIATEWANEKLTVDQMNKLMDQVTEAQDKISSKKNENNPFAQLGAAIGNRKTAKENYKSGLADPTKTKEDLADLESKANNANKSLAEAAGSALMGAQSILQSVVGGLDELGLLTEQQKKDAENVMGMVGGAADIAMGIASGNPMQIIQGSIDLLVNGYKLFDTRTKDAEKKIKEMDDRVKNLKTSYEDLSDAIDRTFSTDKAKIITQQIANLKEQNDAISKQIDAENSKKKPDKGAIQEYQDQIKENNKLIRDQKDAWIEALTGTDVMSAIDSFAQAYAEAWTSNENASKKSIDVVKGIIRNGLIEYMKSKLQPEVNNLMNSIAGAMTDGKISESEQQAIDVLTSALDKKAEQYKNALDPYLEKSGTKGVTGELQAAMTEGTGSQLVGLWNMTAMDIRWIREWLTSMSMGSDTTNLTSSTTQLNAIVGNTYETSLNTKQIAELLDSIFLILNGLNTGSRNTSRSIEL